MNDDLGIKLQAYLDGELKQGERAEVERLLATDSEMKALLQELTAVKNALRDTDPVVSVPASREFYWSQIERRLSAEPVRAAEISAVDRFFLWARRLALPLTGVAAACLMIVTHLHQDVLPTSAHEETESPLAETGALTFRSESQKVTVVWLYDREQSVPEPTTE